MKYIKLILLLFWPIIIILSAALFFHKTCSDEFYTIFKFLMDFQTFFAALIALFAALFSGYQIVVSGREASDRTDHRELVKKKRELLLERIHLAGSFIGELEGILYLLDTRNVSGEYKNNAENIKNNGTSEILKFPVKREYFNVYNKSCERLGVFSEGLGKDIARIYTYANGVIDFLIAISTDFYQKEPNYYKIKICNDIAKDVDGVVREIGKVIGKLKKEQKTARKKVNNLAKKAKP